MSELVQKARALHTKSYKRSLPMMSANEYILALACARGEVSIGQFQRAMGLRSVATAYVFLFKAFRLFVTQTDKLHTQSYPLDSPSRHQ